MFIRTYQVPWKNVVLLVTSFIAFIVLAIIVRNSVYLLSEFVFISNNTGKLDSCNEMDINQPIPLIMHQIYGFKDLEMKPDHKNKRQMWTNMHKNYTQYLWNETAVTSLVQKEYGHLYNLFMSYDSWVQRADVGRYVVLYHYGGWYVDIDIGCSVGIHEVAAEAYRLKKHVVLRQTLPVGTSNDIFGVTPRHPYLKSVLEHLPVANRWFVIPHWNILFSAGSTYMWGRYLNYPCKNDVIVLEEDRYKKYFLIEHDGSWHSWDTGTINVLHSLLRSRVCLPAFFILLTVLFCTLLRLTPFCRQNGR